VFIKVTHTKRTKNRFRGKVICGLNTDIVTQNEFLPSELQVLILNFCATKCTDRDLSALYKLKGKCHTIPE
jgi:hypothetical protein